VAGNVIEFALDEVRRAPNALRAAQFVADVLLEMGAEKQTRPVPERVVLRFGAAGLGPRDGTTARGALPELLLAGPSSQEDLAVVNCFFAVGVVYRLESLPRENRRGFARDVARRVEFLLCCTPFTPFEFLPVVAPTELGVELWDALVGGLIEEANRSGTPPSDSAMVRAESLRHLPREVRRAYTRRILTDCFEPEAALRYGSLLTALDEPGEAAAPALLEAPRRPPALPPPRAQDTPPARLVPSQKVEPLAAVRGELAPGPADLLVRALLLVSGVLLLRDLGALILRLVGVRRTTSLVLAEGELVAEERVRILGRTIWQRRRAYAAPAVARIARDVPYGRLYLLLVLSILTLLGALVLSVVSPDSSDAVRYGLFAACGAVLAGIAIDLMRFLASYLQRGHCTVTIDVHGGDRYRLAGVPTPAVLRFAEVARGMRGRGRPPAPAAARKADG
jgi:hypothetical protein